MTDAPLSITDDGLVLLNGTEWAFVVPAQQKQIAAQLAAAARVPALLDEIAVLRRQLADSEETNRSTFECYRDERDICKELEAEIERLTDEVQTLRADSDKTRDWIGRTLAAAPDLTELREYHNTNHIVQPEVIAIVDRLLDAAPSTGTDGGAA